MLDRLSVLLSSVLPSSMDKGRKALKYRGEVCLNCGHKLDKSDRYCSRCSQLNSTRKLHFKDFFFEFFAGIFAYDSRLIRTLKVLIFRPGQITKEYTDGKRMHYANPFRFYLSVSIIFFLLWGIITKVESYQVDENANPVYTHEKTTAIVDSTSQKIDSAQKEIDSIQKNKVNVSFPGTNNFNVHITEDSLQTEDTSKKTKKTYLSETEINQLSLSNRMSEKLEIYSDFHQEHRSLSPREALEQLNHQVSSSNLWLYKKTVDMEFFRENTDFAVDYFFSKLPFVIFFFIPVFALCIKLLYIRKNRFTYMEHLTFAFHVQSLLFVLMIFALILDFIFDSNIFGSIAIFIFAFYLYKALRRFYEQGRFKTIVKFMILNTLFTILATFTAIVYVLLSFSLY